MFGHTIRHVIASAGLLAAVLWAGPWVGLAGAQEAPEKTIKPQHAIAMHGEPKYGPDFQNFDYANPNAPKGGDVKLVAIGSFDNLNPFILKGISAAGLGATTETLLTGSGDEAFTQYGLLAESLEVPDDRSWVIFTIRKEARWHDGKPVTPEDVVFSLETLKAKGHPFYRSYYKSIAKAEKIGARRVKFTFDDGENRELPLIAGQIPILPKHYWESREFDKTTLDAPLGSGPYRVKEVDPGRSITYERVADYWGENVPANRGLNNFDTIRYDYYRDTTVSLEAFKSGAYDFRQEFTSKDWATAYQIDAVKNGLIVKEEISHERPQGMQAFVYNIRKPLFQDARVRRALAYAFDFEWSNKNLFYGLYKRTASYFANSELASSGLPEGEELAILEKYRGRIPDEVFTTPYTLPVTDGMGNIRPQLRAAFKLLKEAGWTIKSGKLTNAKGEVFAFELLLNQPVWERIALPLKENLARLGIDMRVRTVDTAQYQKRMENFEYDMVVDVFGQSLSPGNEQRDYWTTTTADVRGSRNTIGLKDPVVDELVDLLIAAPSRQSLIARTRALDRVLLWGHYVIPNWHANTFRVAHWNRFSRPAINPKYDLCFTCWWVDANKDAALKTRTKGN